MRRMLLLTALLLLALSACGETATEPDDFPSTTPFNVPVEPTATEAIPSEPGAAIAPTQPLEMRLYTHPSGVFYLNIPILWEVVDESDVLTLNLRFIPPLGYGSRMSLAITNEGPLTPEAQVTMAESVIADTYLSDPRYSHLARTDDGVGRFIVTADYDDGTGGTGSETMILQQVGPFFAVQRIFLATSDRDVLGESLEVSAESLYIDTLAIWGSQAASINPAELLITNDRVWTSGSKTIYAGDIYNASPHRVSELQVRVAFCSSAGAIRREVIEPALIDEINPGQRSPFYIVSEDMPRNTGVCISQVTAKPATENPRIIHSLEVTFSLERDNRGEYLAIGRIVNPGMTPVTAVTLSVLLYDSEGLIAGFGQMSLGPADVLLPGDGRDFIITFSDLGGEPVNTMAYTSARLFEIGDTSLAP